MFLFDVVSVTAVPDKKMLDLRKKPLKETLRSIRDKIAAIDRELKSSPSDARNVELRKERAELQESLERVETALKRKDPRAFFNRIDAYHHATEVLDKNERYGNASSKEAAAKLYDRTKSLLLEYKDTNIMQVVSSYQKKFKAWFLTAGTALLAAGAATALFFKQIVGALPPAIGEYVANAAKDTSSFTIGIFIGLVGAVLVIAGLQAPKKSLLKENKENLKELGIIPNGKEEGNKPVAAEVLPPKETGKD